MAMGIDEWNERLRVKLGTRERVERSRAKMDAVEAKMKGQLEGMRQARDDAIEAAQRWCPNCQQNVNPVRKATATRLIMTGGLGYAASSKDSCPICRRRGLDPPHSPPDPAAATASPTAPTASTAAQIKEWKDLLDSGAITLAEYDAKKAEILAGR